MGGNTIHTFTSNGTFAFTGSPTASIPHVYSCSPTAFTIVGTPAAGFTLDWYDAATGGNLLDSSTALTDGQLVYASQIYVASPH